MTEEEINAAAVTDPDNPPRTAERAKRMQRVPQTEVIRRALGLTQEEFAERCDLDRTYISGIERGKRNVALRNIETIAQALNITISELLRGV